MPSATLWAVAQAWPSDVNWTMLGAAPPGRRSLFVFSAGAGAPPTTPAAAFGNARGFDGQDVWFISAAIGDLDGDTGTMMYESYSHSKGIWCSHGDGFE